MSPIFQGDCSGTRTVDSKVYIGDMSIRNYIQKFIKPMSNRNEITCGCKTCTSAMILQSDLNKRRL